VKYKIVLLTKKEVKEKLFKMKKNLESFGDEPRPFSNMIIKTKKIYISMLGRIDEVCWYFDGMTSLCLIHLNKPYACQQFFC